MIYKIWKQHYLHIQRRRSPSQGEMNIPAVRSQTLSRILQTQHRGDRKWSTSSPAQTHIFIPLIWSNRLAALSTWRWASMLHSKHVGGVWGGHALLSEWHTPTSSQPHVHRCRRHPRTHTGQQPRRPVAVHTVVCVWQTAWFVLSIDTSFADMKPILRFSIPTKCVCIPMPTASVSGLEADRRAHV